MRSSAFARVIFCAVCAALASFAPNAAAHESPQATSEVVFDGGYAYWGEVGAQVAAANTGGDGAENKPAPVMASLVQMSLTTGARRVLYSTFSGYKIWFEDVAAGGGRVAFTQKTYSRSKDRPDLKKEIFQVYTLTPDGAAPALLEQQAMVYRGAFEWFKKKGKKYREWKVVANCGGESHAADVSELGDVLVKRSSVPCTRAFKRAKKRAVTSNHGERYKAYAYVGGAAPAVPLGDATWTPMRLRAGELIAAGENDTVVARNLTNGAQRVYQHVPAPYALEATADHRLAAITKQWVDKEAPPVLNLMLYAPDATDPAMTVPVAANEATAVHFCGDYLVQVSGPNKYPKADWLSLVPVAGPYRVTLRDLAGNVSGEVAGPLSGDYLGATCDGRTAYVATNTEGGVVFSSYAL